MKNIFLKITSLSLLLVSNNITAQEWQAPPATVELAEVKNIMLALSTEVPANIISENYAWLSAETTGRILSIVDIGTQVKKGDIVAVIDTTTLRAQREEQKNSVKSAGARINYLRNQVKRLTELQTQNIAAVSQIEDNQSQLDLAISNKAVNEARLAQVDIAIAASKIRAQFDGTITEHSSQKGEVVSSGTQMLRVVDTKNKLVIVRTPLTNIRYAKVGDSFIIKNNTQKSTAKIIALIPYGDLSNGVYEIRLALKEDSWNVGESLTLEIPQSKGVSVLSVPRDAILLRSGGSSLIKVNADNSFERIMVSTGMGNENYIEVKALDGQLNIKDKVIVRGGERLQDGQKLVIKE